MYMRRISHILLILEAIILVFFTFLGGVLLLGVSGHVWTSTWAEWNFFDALTWTAMLLMQAFAAGILFVPTFLHLSAEVWLWPPGM